MSLYETLAQNLRRPSGDADVWCSLQSRLNPANYRPQRDPGVESFTPDEVAAIKSADPSKIQELGVDERVSKAAGADKLYMQDAADMSSAVTNIPWTQLPSILKHLLNP